MTITRIDGVLHDGTWFTAMTTVRAIYSPDGYEVLEGGELDEALTAFFKKVQEIADKGGGV